MSEREPADMADDMRWILGWMQATFAALSLMMILRVLIGINDWPWWWTAFQLFATAVAMHACYQAGRRAKRYRGLSVTFHFPSRSMNITRERR